MMFLSFLSALFFLLCGFHCRAFVGSVSRWSEFDHLLLRGRTFAHRILFAG
jgi:hypothetical protein